MGAHTHTGRRALRGERWRTRRAFAGVSGSAGQRIPGSAEASTVLRGARPSLPTTPSVWVVSITGTTGKCCPWEALCDPRSACGLTPTLQPAQQRVLEESRCRTGHRRRRAGAGPAAGRTLCARRGTARLPVQPAACLLLTVTATPTRVRFVNIRWPFTSEKPLHVQDMCRWPGLTAPGLGQSRCVGQAARMAACLSRAP